MIKVLLAFPDQVERKAIMSVLDHDAQIEVLANGADASELFSLVQSAIYPDVIVLQLDLGDEKDFNLLGKLAAFFSKARLLLISDNEDPCVLKTALDAGARGVLSQDVSPEELRFAVHGVAEGMEVIGTSLALGLLNKLAVETPGASDISVLLSEREQEILRLIAEGYTNSEIADKTFTSKRTVEGHRSNLINKFKVKNTAQLVRVACNSGHLRLLAG